VRQLPQDLDLKGRVVALDAVLNASRR